MASYLLLDLYGGIFRRLRTAMRRGQAPALHGAYFVAREKVNWPKGPREAGLGRDLGARITVGASRMPRPTKGASKSLPLTREVAFAKQMTEGETGRPHGAVLTKISGRCYP